MTTRLYGKQSRFAWCLALLVALWCVPHNALAQEVNAGTPVPRLLFERLSVEQGLSQSSVNTILQDQQGFLWFGTEDGLDRYDGYDFTVYRPERGNPDSLAFNWISALYEDRDGVLWVGTYGGGLDRLDRRTGNFVHYRSNAADPGASNTNYVRTILEDRYGVLWVGTNAGLDAYDAVTRRLDRYRANSNQAGSLSNNTIRSLYEDRNGTLWIGTAAGLNRLDPNRRTFSTFGADPANPSGLGEDTITAIGEDRAGNLWVGTDCQGLNRLDQSTGQWQHYEQRATEPHSLSNNCIRFIRQDRAGMLWIGTAGGLNRYDPASDNFSAYRSNPRDPNSLGTDELLSFLEDRSGVIWIGTYGSGVSKLDRSANRFTLYRNDPYDPNSLSDNMVRAFVEDAKGDLWVGTDGGGLNRFDPGRERAVHYRVNAADPTSLSSDRVRALYIDSASTLWVGTYGGLNRYDPAQDGFVHFRYTPANPASLSADSVRAIVQDRDGMLWVGTDAGGLNALELATGKIARFNAGTADSHGLTSNAIRALFVDRDDALWVGTGDVGVFRLDRATGQFVHYPVGLPDGLSSTVAMSIYQDRQGTVWVGTFGGGLCQVRASERAFTCLTQQDGLPNDVIYGILEDDQGGLWLSTNGGLSHFDPQAHTFANYTAADGLQSNEFNGGAYYLSPRGEMFFGGIDGFNVFRPRDVRQKNTFVPPVVLTSLTQGGEALGDGELPSDLHSVMLRWPRNFFEFGFAALSFTRPEKNQYAYKLDGFRGENWNYVGTGRTGRYTNLPGGRYTLRVKGSNSDGVWNEEGVSLVVTVVPPFWETWPFRIAVGLIFAGAVAGGLRWRVKNVEERSRRLEIEVGERTHEIEQRRQELAALYRADEELYGHLRTNDVLSTLVEIAVRHLCADKSAVLTWDVSRERLVVQVTRGFVVGTAAELSAACGASVAARVARSGEAAVVENAPDDPLLDGETAEALRVLNAEGIRSILHLPIKVGDEVFGVFCVAYTRAHAFDADEQRLFAALVQRAAGAIENAQLYERAQQAAVLEERGRLARDLHDAVTQTLFSASLIAEALPSIWASNQAEGEQLLQELRQLSRGALAEMRTLLLELRPAALMEADLGDLLRQLAEAAGGRAGVDVRVRVDGKGWLPDAVHEALYRIIQESLNNVVKHAHAQHVEVMLRRTLVQPLSRSTVPGAARVSEAADALQVELRIADDGRGFDPNDVLADHLGLSIIRERAQEIGARLNIASELGAGTRIELVWPGDSHASPGGAHDG